MHPLYDEADGFWTVVDDDGNELAGTFESEQDAADWIEMQEDYR